MSAHHHLLHHRGVWGLQVRLRAGWERDDLDRRLAEGADPAVNPLLHARAERLVTPASRDRLAAGLERVVATVDKPASPLCSAVPVRRRPVCGARHELMRLAGELRHMPDPRPRGVAMAERLLTEPSSALYTASSSDEVARAARDAANTMRAHEPPAHHDAPREEHARKASTSLRTTPARAAEPASTTSACRPSLRSRHGFQSTRGTGNARQNFELRRRYGSVRKLDAGVVVGS